VCELNRYQESTGAPIAVQVKVALTGPGAHQIRARGLFDAMGWEVLEAEDGAYSESRTVDGISLGGVVRRLHYTLHIPVKREAGHRRERWAIQEVENLADHAHLDMRPVSAQLLGRQRRREPHWFVCAPRSSHATPWVRRLFNLQRRMGLHDTGTVLCGSEDEAQQHAGRGCVRPPFPRRASTHDAMRRIPVADGRRWAVQAAVLCWVAGSLGCLTAGPWWLVLSAIVMWVLLTWRCAAIALRDVPWRPTVRRGRSLLPPDDRRIATRNADQLNEDAAVSWRRGSHVWVTASVSNAALFATTAALAWGISPTTALGAHLVLAGTVFVTAGIRRLVRAGSRRPFFVAVFVALLPVALPALGGLSPALFTFYGAAFHVPAEKMDIPEVWQFLASTYALGISAVLTLVFLACWSYIQPCFRRPTLRPILPVAAVTWLTVFALAWMATVLDGASAAGDEAVRQWRSGRAPDDYYAANPHPVCVTPIGALKRMPLYGHRLDPKQVYGSFGVVDGEVTLWDPDSGDTFPVRADKVQVLPAGDGSPGDLIPSDCPSSRQAKG